MSVAVEKDYSKKILTIPNILSMLRLAILPIIVWVYCAKEDYVVAFILLLVSGATDVLDGFIARHFHMVSDFGKALDPVADKMTQGVLLICLLTRFTLMWIPLILMALKEFFIGLTGLMVLRKTGNVYSAEWHGKVNTCIIYSMIVLHLVWPDIPLGVSVGFVVCSVLIMGCSCFLYAKHNIQRIREAGAKA